MADEAYQYVSITGYSPLKGFNPFDPLNLFGGRRASDPNAPPPEPGPLTKIADALKSLSIAGTIVVVVLFVGVVYLIAKVMGANIHAGASLLGDAIR